MDNTLKINTALELENLKKYDFELYEKIKQLIINARELKALKDGELKFIS